MRNSCRRRVELHEVKVVKLCGRALWILVLDLRFFEDFAKSMNFNEFSTDSRAFEAVLTCKIMPLNRKKKEICM